MNVLEEHLLMLLRDFDAREDTHEVQFALASPRYGWSWQWPYGVSSKPYFIASITKLYTTALVMQLRDEGAINLDQPAAAYLGESIVEGVHRYQGEEYSQRITVRELLSHTSGIADYFEQKPKNGVSLFTRILRQDSAWSFDDVLGMSREMRPQFKPSALGKAFYSDTNYQLLGAIIEAVTKRSYEQVLQQRILEPLGLKNTYVFMQDMQVQYQHISPMLYGKHFVEIPKAMASFRADGGIVSTTGDGLIFLKSFMAGQLFSGESLEEMQMSWNKVFPVLDYGVGLMRFKLPRYYTLFRKVPRMLGHSGASGAVLFYVPELDLYISGTVNQIKKRRLPYQLLARLAMVYEKFLSK